jgi:hypothetical protein
MKSTEPSREQNQVAVGGRDLGVWGFTISSTRLVVAYERRACRLRIGKIFWGTKVSALRRITTHYDALRRITRIPSFQISSRRRRKHAAKKVTQNSPNLLAIFQQTGGCADGKSTLTL